MFLFPSVYVESESRPERALRGPSAGNQSIKNHFEIWQPTATSTESRPPCSYFLLLWWFPVGWWVALMMILGNRCVLMLCAEPRSLTDCYTWIIFQTPRASKSHRERAAFDPRCHCDFLALGWHLDVMKEEQSFGQQMGKWGNVRLYKACMWLPY